MLEWRCDLDAAAWDRALARLGGHPLQSALWGDARRQAGGTEDLCWAVMRGDDPVWMARVERRKLPAFGWVGWVPRGPTGTDQSKEEFPAELKSRLPGGLRLLVFNPWQSRADGESGGARTIWIDLAPGLETLSRNLDKQWRYGVGRARRLGVAVDADAGAGDVADFFALCAATSVRKRFRLVESLPMLEALLARSGDDVEAKLFLARYQGRIGAGAFIIRCGCSMHYFWGATDRDASEARAGEAVQWAVIEWGVAKGCTRYDLEGIDPVENPGTYAFKRKMGGVEIPLCGKQYVPFDPLGSVVAWVDARRN